MTTPRRPRRRPRRCRSRRPSRARRRRRPRRRCRQIRRRPTPSSRPDAGPTFDAGAVLGPGRRARLAARRDRPPAARHAVGAAAADVDRRLERWTPADATGPSTRWRPPRRARADGTAVVGGAVDDAAGPVPRSGRSTTTALGAARSIDGAPGTVVALTAEDDGALVALVAGSAGPAVAVEQADGGWRTTALPVDADVAGVASRAGVVVVTGAHGGTAAAWRSTDGGATFAPSDGGGVRCAGPGDGVRPGRGDGQRVRRRGVRARSRRHRATGWRSQPTARAGPRSRSSTRAPSCRRSVAGARRSPSTRTTAIWLTSAAPQPLVYRVHDLRRRSARDPGPRPPARCSPVRPSSPPPAGRWSRSPRRRAAWRRRPRRRRR